MKVLSVGSFNVRGLTKDLKKDQLPLDLANHKVDICGLRETKIKNGVDQNIKNYRLISEPSACQYYGNGFMISLEMIQYIHKHWKVSDRINVLQISNDEE